MTIGAHSFIRRPFKDPYKVEVVVGKYTSIAAWLRIVDVAHPSLSDRKLVSNYAFNEDLGCPDYPNNKALGKITIGNDVLIGAYCILTAGITIGDGAIIKAGSRVSVDVPPYAVMDGNTIQGYRFNKETREMMLGIKWWDWPDNVVKGRMHLFKDHWYFKELFAKREGN
ncbi:MAG: DapH/DapD/GlmU-related protein [Patescibacteria group bacterium]|jgi:acetyltransferase-like isoleucine patch superfamily enzyme